MDQPDIEKSIESFFHHKQQPKKRGKKYTAREAAKAIAQVFVDRNIRMKGPLPSRAEYPDMENRLELSTQTGESIPTIVQFGGAKTARYCPYPDPDVAELMALEHLARINNKIRAVYPPGLKIMFVIADSYYSYVFGYDSGVEPYAKGMEDLIEAMNLSYISPVRMSALVDAFGTEKVMTRCYKNVKLMQKYWDTGTRVSYQRLLDVGWKGKLPQVQRDSYMKRAARILSKKKVDEERIKEEKKAATIRFLAYALMLAQFDLVGRGPPQVIDVSYVPLAPGEPKELYKRFRIAPMPTGGTSRSAPPWSVQGILALPKCRPTILTYVDVEDERYVFQREYSLKIGCCSVRADLYTRNVHR